jgi:hypothetical protein
MIIKFAFSKLLPAALLGFFAGAIALFLRYKIVDLLWGHPPESVTVTSRVPLPEHLRVRDYRQGRSEQINSIKAGLATLRRFLIGAYEGLVREPVSSRDGEAEGVSR